MKTTIASLVTAASILLFGYSYAGVAQNQTDTAKHEPNGGYVADAAAATDIAKIVLSHLLTPADLKHKEFFDATLKDGVWTVQCREPKARISFPILIQIRQKTGGVVKYEDPNA